jgi:hypothetical protein
LVERFAGGLEASAGTTAWDTAIVVGVMVGKIVLIRTASELGRPSEHANETKASRAIRVMAVNDL